MKLFAHSKSRAQDTLTIRARLKDRMRQTAALKLSVVVGEQAELDDVIVSGDVREVTGAINAIAEIAWDNGWRPRGLMASVARQIEVYKEPPVAS